MATKILDSSTYQNYVKDLGFLVKELAFEAKQKASEKQTDFATGYMAGFHRIVSLMQQQADAFDLPYEDIGLDDIDADEGLV